MIISNSHPTSRRTGSTAIILLILVILLVTGGAAGYLYWQRQQDRAAQQELSNQVAELNDKLGALQSPELIYEAPVISETPTPSPAAQEVGYVEGKLSFPSEMLPKQRICAVNTATKVESCTETYQGNTYKMSLPPATYHVYASTLDNPGTKAYYSEFVTCGLLASCPSHKPIDVVVKAGATVSNVDTGDWYN